MGLTLSEFKKGIQTPIKSLSRKQLQEREEVWRTLWGWLDPVVIRFLEHIGTTVRFMRRDYKGTIGELGEVKFTPSQIEIVTYEKVYDYNTGKYFYERKVVLYPWASVAWMEEIFDRQEAEEVEQYSIEPVGEVVE